MPQVLPQVAWVADCSGSCSLFFFILGNIENVVTYKPVMVPNPKSSLVDCIWGYRGTIKGGPHNHKHTLQPLSLCVCYLVEQWTVCYGNAHGGEAPAQHHIIRSIITVAVTAAGNKLWHSHPAQHHPTHRIIRCVVWVNRQLLKSKPKQNIPSYEYI